MLFSALDYTHVLSQRTNPELRNPNTQAVSFNTQSHFLLWYCRCVRSLCKPSCCCVDATGTDLRAQSNCHALNGPHCGADCVAQGGTQDCRILKTTLLLTFLLVFKRLFFCSLAAWYQNFKPHLRTDACYKKPQISAIVFLLFSQWHMTHILKADDCSWALKGRCVTHQHIITASYNKITANIV